VIGITLVVVIGMGPKAGDVLAPAAIEQEGQSDTEKLEEAPAAQPTQAPEPTSVPEPPRESFAPTEVPAGTPHAVVPSGLPPCPGLPLDLELVSQSVQMDDGLPAPRLVGVLYDMEDAPIADVTLFVTATAGWQGFAVTDAEGAFALDLPEEGTYALVLALADADVAEDMGYNATEGGDWARTGEVESDEFGRCVAPLDLDLPSIELGPHDEVELVLRIR
jgi:hypothetical protein